MELIFGDSNLRLQGDTLLSYPLLREQLSIRGGTTTNFQVTTIILNTNIHVVIVLLDEIYKKIFKAVEIIF